MIWRKLSVTLTAILWADYLRMSVDSTLHYALDHYGMFAITVPRDVLAIIKQELNDGLAQRQLYLDKGQILDRIPWHFWGRRVGSRCHPS